MRLFLYEIKIFMIKDENENLNIPPYLGPVTQIIRLFSLQKHERM